MRSVEPALTTNAKSNYRKPEAKIIVRDTLLRFGDPATCAYTPIVEQACVHDSDVLGDSRVLQAAVGNQTALNFRLANAGLAPKGAWSTFGAAKANCVPGVYSNTVYYVDSNGKTRGASYTGSMGLTSLLPSWSVTGLATLAPADNRMLFVAELVSTSIQFYAVNIATGARNVCSRRVYDSPTFPLASTYQNFDAFTFTPDADNATYFIVYSDSSQTKVMSYRDGVWGEPTFVVPPDYTKFTPYRATVINGKAFLTGKLLRENMLGYSPSMEAYLYSADGLNWTALPRQSYLNQADMRGKLLLSGSKLIYLGVTNCQEADASYFVGYDAEAKKETVTARVNGFNVSFPASKTSPSADFSLANGDNHFLTDGLLKAGSEAWIEGGYSGSTAALLQARVEGVSKSIANGQASYDAQLSDSAFGDLKNWEAPFYFDWRSQTKHHDTCANMSNLVAMGNGQSWNSHTSNLWPTNNGFELAHVDNKPPDWKAYSTASIYGAGSGQFIHRTNMDENGVDQSLGGCEIVKSDNTTAHTDCKFGLELETPFSAQAGLRYVASLSAYVKSMPDGGEVVLEVTGTFGPGGATSTLTSTKATTGGWDLLAVNFTNENTANANISIRVYLHKANIGNLVVDNFNLEGDGQDALSFNDKLNEGILFSATPFETADFDVRGLFRSSCSVGYRDLHYNDRIGFGVVGLATDADNYVVLKVFRNTTSGTPAAASNIQLCKKRGGVYTLLASATSSSVTANTDIWVRLTHQGGKFNCYVTQANAGGGADWGDPIISYQWSDTADVPCPSANGKGKLGVWAVFKPYQFHIYGIHPHSLYLPLRFENDGDWSNAAWTGNYKIVVDEEVMDINTGTDMTLDNHLWSIVKTNSSHLPVTGFYNANGGLPGEWPLDTNTWMNADTLNTYRSLCTPTFASVQSPESREDDAWIYHALVVTAGAATGRVWYIHRSWLEHYDARNDGVILWVGSDGNEYCRNDGGFMSAIVGSSPGGGTVVKIAPCLRVSRGTLGHTIVAHADSSICYLYTDDLIQLKTFEAFDYETDFNTERLIKRICSAAGVISPEFNSYLSTAYLTPVAQTLAIYYYDVLGDPQFTPIDLKDFDIEFDCGGGSSYLDFHCSDATGSPENFHRLSITATTLTLRRVNTVLQTVTLAQPLTAPYHIRVVVNDNWVTVYTNGAIALNNYDDTLSLAVYNGLRIFNSVGSLTNVRIPELHDWRDAVYADNDSSAISALDNIIGERYILYISRNGTIKFSAFDVKDDLGLYENTIYTETLAPDISNIVTYLRIYAAEIMEVVDDGLAKKFGLIFKAMQMTKASTALVATMIKRIFRQIREGLERRQVTLAADPRVEVEDYCQIHYAAAGSGIETESMDGPSPQVVINDVQYSYSPASFEMTIGTRRYKALGDENL